MPVVLLLAVAAATILLAGCTGTAPTGQATPSATAAVATPAGLPSYMEHIAGVNRGVVVLVGRTTCPWCQKDKALLANLSVDYYWVDLNSLDADQTAQVMAAVKVCGQTNSVPILVINGRQCIIGYQEAQIREALK
jgi:glutaredoxin